MIMTRNRRRLHSALEIGAIVAAAFIILATCGLRVQLTEKYTPNIFGYWVCTITSGSMEPTLRTGEECLVQAVNEDTVIRQGVIVAYEGEVDGSKTLIAHRVVDIFASDGNVYYTCRGDANTKDDKPITRDKIKYIVIP